jgi:restriction system protein
MFMSGFWMVRAGEGGYLIEEFADEGYVGIGWQDAGDFTNVQTLDEMRG